jgi:predicted DNA-binding transcriptional regulator YafY
LVTAQKLAERLEVSTRTIYRDIADLQSTGVPIDGEAGVGYVMEVGYDLPPLMFTHDEVTALVAGARLIRAFGGAGMARAAEEALVKIGAVLPEEARAKAAKVQVHAIGWRISEDLRALIDRLEDAVDRSVRLSFSYRDKDGTATRRTVRPLGLWFWGASWTLVGWCELRGDFRMFRLDRMDDIEDGPSFKPESGKRLQDFYRKMDAWGERHL